MFIHIDLDCYFVSAERTRYPFLKDKNVVVAKSSDKKIARNEVCPCGSGLKYKQCCGKSGPKRGLVAGI